MKNIALALTVGVIVTLSFAILIHPTVGVVAGFGAGYLSLRFRTEVWPRIWAICPKTGEGWAIVGAVIGVVALIVSAIGGIGWIGGKILLWAFGPNAYVTSSSSATTLTLNGFVFWFAVVMTLVLSGVMLVFLGLMSANCYEFIRQGLYLPVPPVWERNYEWPKLMVLGLIFPINASLWLLWLVAVIYSKDRLLCACWGVVGGIVGYQTTLVSANPTVGLAVGLLVGVGLGLIQYLAIGQPLRRWFDRRATAAVAAA